MFFSRFEIVILVIGYWWNICLTETRLAAGFLFGEFDNEKKKNLAKLRKHFGLAQWDVADELDMPQARYSQFESGRRQSDEFEEEAREAIRRIINTKIRGGNDAVEKHKTRIFQE